MAGRSRVSCCHLVVSLRLGNSMVVPKWQTHPASWLVCQCTFSLDPGKLTCKSSYPFKSAKHAVTPVSGTCRCLWSHLPCGGRSQGGEPHGTSCVVAQSVWHERLPPLGQLDVCREQKWKRTQKEDFSSVCSVLTVMRLVLFCEI